MNLITIHDTGILLQYDWKSPNRLAAWNAYDWQRQAKQLEAENAELTRQNEAWVQSYSQKCEDYYQAHKQLAYHAEQDQLYEERITELMEIIANMRKEINSLQSPKPPYDTSHTLREKLGRRVREVWVTWAKEQENPIPGWLTPWDGLSEPMKEVDRRIGCAIWGDCIAQHAAAIAKDALPQPTEEKVRDPRLCNRVYSATGAEYVKEDHLMNVRVGVVAHCRCGNSFVDYIKAGSPKMPPPEKADPPHPTEAVVEWDREREMIMPGYAKWMKNNIKAGEETKPTNTMKGGDANVRQSTVQRDCENPLPDSRATDKLHELAGQREEL